MLEPVLELCQSSNQEIWISKRIYRSSITRFSGLIFGYKCLIMIFGVFLTRETRRLRVRYVNDSRFVHLSIYNATLLSIIGSLIATLLVRDQANANFSFVAVPGSFFFSNNNSGFSSHLHLRYSRNDFRA